jgi:hypothetical protein
MTSLNENKVIFSLIFLVIEIVGIISLGVDYDVANVNCSFREETEKDTPSYKINLYVAVLCFVILSFIIYVIQFYLYDKYPRAIKIFILLFGTSYVMVFLITMISSVINSPSHNDFPDCYQHSSWLRIYSSSVLFILILLGVPFLHSLKRSYQTEVNQILI